MGWVAGAFVWIRVSLCVREGQGATCVSDGRLWDLLRYSARGEDKACPVESLRLCLLGATLRVACVGGARL